MLHPHQLYLAKQKLRQPIAKEAAPHLRAVPAVPKQLNKSETSGRMHVAFDQDVDVPDLFQFGGR